eukprot:403337924
MMGIPSSLQSLGNVNITGRVSLQLNPSSVKNQEQKQQKVNHSLNQIHKSNTSFSTDPSLQFITSSAQKLSRANRLQPALSDNKVYQSYNSQNAQVVFHTNNQHLQQQNDSNTLSEAVKNYTAQRDRTRGHSQTKVQTFTIQQHIVGQNGTNRGHHNHIQSQSSPRGANVLGSISNGRQNNMLMSSVSHVSSHNSQYDDTIFDEKQPTHVSTSIASNHNFYSQNHHNNIDTRQSIDSITKKYQNQSIEQIVQKYHIAPGQNNKFNNGSNNIGQVNRTTRDVSQGSRHINSKTFIHHNSTNSQINSSNTQITMTSQKPLPNKHHNYKQSIVHTSLKFGKEGKSHPQFLSNPQSYSHTTNPSISIAPGATINQITQIQHNYNTITSTSSGFDQQQQIIRSSDITPTHSNTDNLNFTSEQNTQQKQSNQLPKSKHLPQKSMTLDIEHVNKINPQNLKQQQHELLDVEIDQESLNQMYTTSPHINKAIQYVIQNSPTKNDNSNSKRRQTVSTLNKNENINPQLKSNTKQKSSANNNYYQSRTPQMKNRMSTELNTMSQKQHQNPPNTIHQNINNRKSQNQYYNTNANCTPINSNQHINNTKKALQQQQQTNPTSQLFKDIQQQHQYKQAKKLEEIHDMIEQKSQQIKIDTLKEREIQTQSKLDNIKEFRKCCRTCKDQNDHDGDHSHSHSNNKPDDITFQNLQHNKSTRKNTDQVLDQYLQEANDEMQSLMLKRANTTQYNNEPNQKYHNNVQHAHAHTEHKRQQSLSQQQQLTNMKSTIPPHQCTCSQELIILRENLSQEQSVRQNLEKKIRELQDDYLGIDSNSHEEYMKQLKSMQQRINEKNTQIQELNGRLNRYNILKSNFKYIASLNHEYLGLDIESYDRVYDENTKVDLEKQYMQISKFNLVKQDIGIQANLPPNPNATLQDYDPYFLRTFKESLDLEREFQTIMNENQLLKQKLYARTLDYKSVNFKIQELKESLQESNKFEKQKRHQAQLVEAIAEYTFKLNNLGVSDVKQQIKKLVEQIYEFKPVLDQLSENEVKDWICKIYSQLVEASGMKNGHNIAMLGGAFGSMGLNNYRRSGARQQKLTLMMDKNSLSKSVQEFGGFFNNQNSTTLSTIQKSFQKDQNLQQVQTQIKLEDSESMNQMLLQMMNCQANHIEEQYFNQNNDNLLLLSSLGQKF